MHYIYRTKLLPLIKSQILRTISGALTLLLIGMFSLYVLNRPQGWIGVILAIIFFLLIPIFLIKGYSYVIYLEGIKFPIYWKICNKRNLVLKENISSIRPTGRTMLTSGLLIITKDNKKYLIIKPYDEQVLPYLEQMMGDLWGEVWKG